MSTDFAIQASGHFSAHAPHTEDDEPIETMRFGRYLEYAASVPPGQFVLRKLHNALWCVENTLKFLLHTDESTTPAAPPANANGESERQQPEKRPAIRPMSWMLLLPTLIGMHACIGATRLVARCTGCPSLAIGGRTITRIQAYRRELRIVRLGGQRIMRLQDKRRRLGLFSRLARFLCERLFHIRSDRQPAAGTLSRKASKIDVNVDLHSALNRTYTDADDANDVTFYPDSEPAPIGRTKRKLSKASSKSPKRRQQPHQQQQQQQQPHADRLVESRAADASDERESSASSDESHGTNAPVTSATESSITEASYVEQH